MEQNMVLKLMRVREGAIIPKQATAGSAGYDLCACMDAPQTIEPGERCASTSNRNFEGRQGAGGRTHLVSPAMAAAAAIHGHFVDVRKFA